MLRASPKSAYMLAHELKDYSWLTNFRGPRAKVEAELRAEDAGGAAPKCESAALARLSSEGLSHLPS